MNIERISCSAVHVNHRGNWLFVHLDTDEGLRGLGEFSHSHKESEAVAYLDELSGRLCNSDPSDIKTLCRELRSDASRPLHYTVISGIEQALWDIRGRAEQKPIRELLGQSMREEIRLYANINRCTVDRSPEGFASNAGTAVSEGFTAIKLAPFDEVRHQKQTPGENLEAAETGLQRVKEVCDAVQPDAEVFVDCHCRFHPEVAGKVAALLHELGVTWMEQPFGESNLDALAKLHEEAPLRIAGGESSRDRADYQGIFDRHALDIIMPDVKHIGGILELRQACLEAERHDILPAPHCPSGPVSVMASAQAMAAIDSFYILEFAYGEADWRADLTDPPERITNGHLQFPNGPGLGCSLNENVLNQHRVAI